MAKVSTASGSKLEHFSPANETIARNTTGTYMGLPPGIVNKSTSTWGKPGDSTAPKVTSNMPVTRPGNGSTTDLLVSSCYTAVPGSGIFAHGLVSNTSACREYLASALRKLISKLTWSPTRPIVLIKPHEALTNSVTPSPCACASAYQANAETNICTITDTALGSVSLGTAVNIDVQSYTPPDYCCTGCNVNAFTVQVHFWPQRTQSPSRSDVLMVNAGGTNVSITAAPTRTASTLVSDGFTLYVF